MGNKASAKQRKRERKRGKGNNGKGERRRENKSRNETGGEGRGKKKVGVQNIQYNFVGVENCWNIRTSINRETKQNKLTITGEFQQIKMEITGIN